MLRSDLCDYSDAYIVVKGRISVTGTDTANRRNKKLTLKKSAPFISFTSKINNTFIGNAEDLNIVVSMYNLLGYSDNYSITSGNIWNYYSDEVDDAVNETDAGNNKVNNNKTTCKSFEYKTNEQRAHQIIIVNAEVVLQLKYLSNFWRSLNLPLINSEIQLDLTWSKNCVLSEILRTPEQGGDNPVEVTLTTGATLYPYSHSVYK